MKRKFIGIVVLHFLFFQPVAAQKNDVTNLYAQTSEMANMMIQYDADRGSIMRFYASSDDEDNSWKPGSRPIIIHQNAANACRN